MCCKAPWSCRHYNYCMIILSKLIIKLSVISRHSSNYICKKVRSLKFGNDNNHFTRTSTCFSAHSSDCVRNSQPVNRSGGIPVQPRNRIRGVPPWWRQPPSQIRDLHTARAEVIDHSQLSSLWSHSQRSKTKFWRTLYNVPIIVKCPNLVSLTLVIKTDPDYWWSPSKPNSAGNTLSIPWSTLK